MGIYSKSRSLNTAYNHYRDIHPSTWIFSVCSLLEYFSTATEATRLVPLKPIVSAIDSDPAPEKRILVHLFSNGGTLSFSDISAIYKAETSHVLPAKGIIFDGCPGRPNLTEAWAAMSASLPRGILWYPAAAAILLALRILSIPRYAFAIPTFIDRIFPKLNDWTLVDTDAKRLYVYSRADTIVVARDPKAHLELAKEVGVEVTVLEEKDTLHMQALIKDEERYWRTVKKL
jgi:hypothetical protein